MTSDENVHAIPQHEHPARPEQTDDGFAEGQESAIDTPEEEVVRDFGEGQELSPPPADMPAGRFSEGQELAPDTPEKTVERRFSEGQDAGPDTV